jgi:hypothetical protein
VSDVFKNWSSYKTDKSSVAAFKVAPKYLGQEEIYWSALLMMIYQLAEIDLLD